jgi:hypothetical protein
MKPGIYFKKDLLKAKKEYSALNVTVLSVTATNTKQGE